MNSKFTLFLLAFIFLLNCHPGIIQVNASGSNGSGESGDEVEKETRGTLEAEEDWDSLQSLEDEVEELTAEDEEMVGMEMEEREEEKVEILGGKPIEISISPVDPDDFSCLGMEDGNQVDPSPSDCLSFYICMNETAYKVGCPKIPYQTYYHPVKRVCDNVEPYFCMEFMGIPPPSEEFHDQEDGGEDFTPDQDDDDDDVLNMYGRVEL